MKTLIKASVSLFVLALVALVAVPASAQTTTGVVTGGGSAVFVATSHSLTTSGYTDFAVNATVRSDGVARGEFICAIPNVVVLACIVRSGHVNSNGSVSLYGTEYGWDNVAMSGYNGCNCSVVLRPGGPGKGGFDFRDCVFGPGQYDTEVVRFGAINLKQ